MRRAAILGLLLAFGVSIAQEPVYRNMSVATGYYVPWFDEYGDEVTLTGTARNITSVNLAYFAELAAPQGDETVVVRLRANDGSGGEPGTLLFQSAALPVLPGAHAVTVAVPNVIVPDTLTWTAQFSGMAGGAGDDAGLVSYDPPTHGASDTGFVWSFTGGNWIQLQYGGNPPANFKASLWAGGDPATPYKNVIPESGWYYPDLEENGDTINLEGNLRRVTSFRFGYFAPNIAQPGSASATIRFYANDGTSGEPGTQLWTSPDLPVVADSSNAQFQDVPVPNVTVPNTFTWTVTWNNILQMEGVDEAGVILVNDFSSSPASRNAEIGDSEDYFMRKDVPGEPVWSYWYFGGDPIANYYAQVTATAATTEINFTSVTIVRGSNGGGTINDTWTSNDQYLRIRSQAGLLPQRFLTAQADFSATGVPTFGTASVRIEAASVPAGTRLETKAFNFITNQFVILDDRPLPTSDTVFTLVGLGPQYRSSSGEFRVRLENYAGSTAISFHTLRLDELKLIISP